MSYAKTWLYFEANDCSHNSNTDIKKCGASCFTDVAVKYFCLAEALYYKSLEVIINQEKKRLGDVDLSVGFIFSSNINHTVCPK